jgi:ABC-2 type transport system ATP-binding protein
MSYTAIEVDHVTKSFKRQIGGATSMLERFLAVGRGRTESFDALGDVAFDVQAGETVGILGHNGSGKSTMLKCISGTIRPTAGAVRVRGSMSALLELGAGFHPDLTGRENVYLNGSILGFSKAQIDQMIDDIIDFSEIPAFIDTQVKNYSSGMFARLGFAVAVNLKPDVLLIDEVLAVGDEAFQRKCLERVRGFQRDGRTIVLVTHSPDMVRLFCDRAVILDSGRMIYCGEPHDGVVVYRDSLEARTGIRHGDGSPTELEPANTSGAGLVAVTVDKPAHGGDSYHPGDTLRFRVRYSAAEAIPAMRLAIWIFSHDGILVSNFNGSDITGVDLLDIEPGIGEVTVTIDDLPLLQGSFEITAALQDVNETFEYDRAEAPTSFSVTSVGGAGAGRVRLKTSIEHTHIGAATTSQGAQSSV